MRPFAAVLLALPVFLAVYQNGPMPGVTGGFGEPTCGQCHVGTPGGDHALSVSAPKTYRAGHAYRLRVRLTRPGLDVGGFEIAARYESGEERGRQAGSLRPIDDRTQLATAKAVQDGQHTEAGSRAADRGLLSWELEWRAPDRPGGAVIFHVAANASNADYSPLGDTIYTAMFVSRQQSGGLGMARLPQCEGTHARSTTEPGRR